MDSNLRDLRPKDYVRKRPFPIKRPPVPHEPAESKTKLILFQTHSKKISDFLIFSFIISLPLHIQTNKDIKMKKKVITLFLLFGLLVQVQAQMKQPDPTVFIFVGDSIFPMNVITSQTELKKGWDIQGINVGRKIKRYFSGAQARQTTGRQPKFAIYPKTQDLNDYALIRLKERRGFRYLPASEFKDCDYTRVELGLFNIENLPGLGFAVTPLTPLFPGEYILVDLSQKPVNQYGDVKAYDFTVEE
ncbi:conserved domain protein [Paraprevotella xylaniphila YIT 11841]|jgi:hypothetical protein|uniref:Conserved domain protein n=2 Tax=Paraprevotella xylaniphila TaxID=454155 RepID=F3QPD5_9BACT|nr:conserved domain protein [Paraprevotella xylaniphila YIT 11841]